MAFGPLEGTFASCGAAAGGFPGWALAGIWVTGGASACSGMP